MLGHFSKIVFFYLILAIQFSAVCVQAGERDEKALSVEALSPASRFDKGRKWAILIGVSEYLDPKVDNLKYCVSDVRLMERVLIEKCGYDQDHILVIADDQKKAHLRPLLTNLQNQIQGWLSKVEQGDTVLLYFSGHGLLDEQQQGYLAPSDCQSDNLAFGAYPTEVLKNKLKICKASQKILILDCCHSGAKGEGDKNPSSEEVAAGFKQAEGLITLASSRKQQRSHEWDQKQQGLFTWFVSEGLGGKADRDQNGIVDSDELYYFLISNVPVVAQRELNKSQTPIRIIGEDVIGVFGLSRVSMSPNVELGTNDVLVHFTIKHESLSEESRIPASNASVELFYRSSNGDKITSLVQGKTDKNGRVILSANLTAEQQLRGEFLVLARKADKSRVWKLTNFPKKESWELTLPVSEDSRSVLPQLLRNKVSSGSPVHERIKTDSKIEEALLPGLPFSKQHHLQLINSIDAAQYDVGPVTRAPWIIVRSNSAKTKHLCGVPSNGCSAFGTTYDNALFQPGTVFEFAFSDPDDKLKNGNSLSLQFNLKSNRYSDPKVKFYIHYNRYSEELFLDFNSTDSSTSRSEAVKAGWQQNKPNIVTFEFEIDHVSVYVNGKYFSTAALKTSPEFTDYRFEDIPEGSGFTYLRIWKRNKGKK